MMTAFVLQVKQLLLSSELQVAQEEWQLTHSPFLAK
jgi:hypothetical protein